MKIKKLCTYENIQLENVDGTRPRGSISRLQKTFLSDCFDMRLIPGVGVSLVNKQEGERASHFLIPFANIPYFVTEHDNDQEAATDRPTIRRRRRTKAVLSPISDTESEVSDD